MNAGAFGLNPTSICEDCRRSTSGMCERHPYRTVTIKDSNVTVRNSALVSVVVAAQPGTRGIG